MILVTLFGRLLVTFASGLSVLLCVVALGAATFIAVTLAQAAALPGGRALGGRPRTLGLAAAGVALLFTMLGLRVGGAAGADFVPTIALGASLACSVGSAVASLWLGGARGLHALSEGAARRRVALEGAESQRALSLEARTRGYLEGADLKDEVSSSEAQLARMKAALDALRGAQGKLDVDEAPPALRDEVTRARDEVAVKVMMGERVLAAAEEATFRLACREPWRRLLRRRPREAMTGLAAPQGKAAMAQSIARAAMDIEAFLVDVRGGREALVGLEQRRPAGAPERGSDSDPLARTARDVETLEAVYQGVLARLEIVRLRLAAQAGMDEVTSAAGAVSDVAAASSPRADDDAMHELLREVSRAEAVGIADTADGDDRALADALARGAAALGGGEPASLEQLVEALREIG